MRGPHLFTVLSIVILLFMALAGVALFSVFRASNYGARLPQINEAGDLMPELFRE